MCWLYFVDISVKLYVCWLEAVQTFMLADVSQVEPASNNNMLLILFVCIFDTPHIVLFLHGFFASYIQRRNMYKVDNFLVTSSSLWKDHIGAYLAQSSHDSGSIALVEPRFNRNSSQSLWWLTFSRKVQLFSPLEGNTAHVRIYKHI
jgi:hypothetical protein